MNYRAICAAGALILGSVIALASDATREATVTVEMTTNLGVVVMELDAENAPISVTNFVKYAKSGHYDRTVFHRVIKGFMVQCGGLNEQLQEKETRAPIANEARNGLRNDKYTVAMARTSDPDSATSQFFINTGDNNFLNLDEAEDGYGYTVFGRVVKGQDVIDKINDAQTEVQANPAFPALLMRDVPVTPIVIETVKLLQTAR